MATIYLVMVDSGSYEDKDTQARKAFVNKEKAEQYITEQIILVETHLVLLDKLDDRMRAWDFDNPSLYGSEERDKKVANLTKLIGFDRTILPTWAEGGFGFYINEIELVEVDG